MLDAVGWSATAVRGWSPALSRCLGLLSMLMEVRVLGPVEVDRRRDADSS